MDTTRILVASTTEIHANIDERTITGLLLPFGEIGQTNAGPIIVQAEHIDLPADPVVVGLNLDHEGPRRGIGPAVKVWKEPHGVMATFAVAKTAAGDAALADARDPQGKRRSLSGEFDVVLGEFDPVAGARRSEPGGVLWGAALVERGAFPSARVLAEFAGDTADETDEAAGTTVAEDHSETVYEDENGKKYRRVYDSETTETAIEGGTETTITTTITEQETTQSEEDDMDTTEVQAAKVGLNTTPAGKTAPREPGKQEILASIATLRRNPLDGGAREVLAALSDIKLTGTGALPGTGVLQQSWLGRIDLGITYVREYINLFKLGTDINANGKAGFKFLRGTAQSPQWGSGDWAGNKTEINSGVGRTTKFESTLDRYARGADIGREFFDLPGGQDVIEAFLAELDLDYHQWSDEKALALAVATAGAPIAPSVYPGVDGHDYAGAMGQLIQGILAVKRRKADGRRDTPTFAIANEKAYEELVYTPKDLIPEFVSFAVNTDGSATADGKVHVVQGDTGVEDTPSVIVGADYALEFDELPGGPLHVNALEIAKGGIDEAVHGYLQKFVRRPEALVHIGTADA